MRKMIRFIWNTLLLISGVGLIAMIFYLPFNTEINHINELDLMVWGILAIGFFILGVSALHDWYKDIQK